jgi:hypothetical protein
VGGASLFFINIEDKLKKRVVGLYSAFLLIIILSTLLTTIIFIPTVSKLFFWRMAPFSVILSQIIFSAAIINHALSHQKEITVRFLITFGLLLLGYLFILRWYSYSYDLTSSKTFLLLGILFIVNIFFLRNIITIKVSPNLLSKNAIIIYCLGMFSLTYAYQFNSAFYQSSTLINDFPRKTEKDLYQWVKTTKQSELFLIPPNMHNFRLHSERAIIVDWKSTPIDPNGLIEWHQRIKDITGLDDIQLYKEVKAAYLTLDKDRLIFLKKKYGINYAVIYRANKSLGHNIKEVFKNEMFIVVSLN